MALQRASKEVQFATPFKFTQAGDTLKGYYQGQAEKTINGNKVIEHTYKTREGLVSVLGQANILTQIRNNKITPGMYVEIVFSGETKKFPKAKAPTKIYDISFDSEDLAEVAAAPVAEQDDEWEAVEEDTAIDEVVAAPVVRPSAPVQAPNAARQAAVQAMLNRTKAAR